MNDNNELLSIDIQYFASVNWYKKVNQYKYVDYSLSDLHAKMSFRNRLWICGADGRLSLSVPIEGSRNEKQLYKDVRIAPGRWALSHFRTITSCYNRSPWFEHYRDELAALYEKPYSFLLDWNLACFHLVNRFLPLQGGASLQENLPADQVHHIVSDFRNYFRPGNWAEWIGTDTIKYTQVFEDRVGFIPGLSILDILFCEGPAARNRLT